MPLYIAKSGDLDRCYRCLTDWLTDSQRKDRATQLLKKYKSGALVTQLNFHFLIAAIATVRNYPESYTTLQTLVVNLVQNQNTRCSFWLLATCESEARLAGEWQSMKSRALNQPVNFQFWISVSRKQPYRKGGAEYLKDMIKPRMHAPAPACPATPQHREK